MSNREPHAMMEGAPILDVRILIRGDVVELNGKRWTFQQVNWAEHCRWVELELVGQPLHGYQPSIHWVEAHGRLCESYADPFADEEDRGGGESWRMNE